MLIFALVAAAWPFAVPAYNSAVRAGAEVVFRIVEAPNVTDISSRGDEILILRSEHEDGQARPFSVFTRYFYVALVPLLSLLLAIPGIGWLKRAKLIGLGLCMLYVFHIGYVVVAVRLAYVSYGLTMVNAAQAQFYEWIQVLVRAIWDIVAVVIWVGLTLPYWRGRGIRFGESQRPKRQD